MSLELLSRLHAQGVNIEVTPNKRLRLWPASKLTTQLFEEVNTHRNELYTAIYAARALIAKVSRK